MNEITITDAALRAANEGARLAERVLNLLAAGESVRIDLAPVEIMTPSFANTLVMLILERHDVAELRTRCEFVNRSQHIIEVMNKAVARFQSGIRLSSQLAPA